MNKRYSIIFIALIFVLSGCANTKNKADSQNGINVYTETENNKIGIIEDTSEEISQEYYLFDEEIKEDSEMSKENQKVYQGKEFKFYKADSSLLPPDTSNIFEIYGAEYDEERNTYYEKYDASYHSLFIGQCLTLFGDVDYQSDDNEDLLSYVVAAEDEDNNVIYMEIYYGPSGPAIGGVAFDDTYSRAAEELSQIIMDAEPTDFEITSTYGDLGATIEMGVKDGKAYYNTVWPDNYFDGIEDVM